MRARLESALRVLVVVVGIAVTVTGMLAMRLEDWPIYVVFVVLSLLLFGPAVEVEPGLTLPLPGLALCLGFLYVGGLPILFLRNLAPPFLIQLLRWAVPPRWRGELVGPRWGRGPALPKWGGDERGDAAIAADWSAFSIGLAVRWWIASWLVPSGPPITNLGAIVLAELGGYAVWSVLSALPVMSFDVFQRTAPRGKLELVYSDLGLIMLVALTPFVVLIAYGYAVNGLAGAVGWSVGSLGLHFMLRRLNDRRLIVEEQNRRLEALNRELEHRERLSAIGKMSSVVSHQLLQQLGIIRLHADLIGHVDPDTDPQAALGQVVQHAGRIDDALDGVNRVLTDLLVFSRDLRLNVYEHPLDRVLAEAVDECRPQAAERGVALRLDVAPDVAVVLDKLKMKQAVANLVRNAIDAAPPGSEVAIEGRTREDGVEIAVTDHGPGIPAADRDKVFTPFFTTKPEGTGLGLAIAREFVGAHGGRIDAESLPEGGARFTIRLPLRPPPSPAAYA